MIFLIRMEAYKLWHKRSFLTALIMIFFINLGLLAYTDINQPIPPQAYQNFQKTLSAIPNEQRYAFVCDYDDKIQAFMILQQIRNAQLHHDEAQLASIRTNYPDIEKKYAKEFEEQPSYYTSSLEQEASFLQEIRYEMESLHAYHDRLSAIEQKAIDISSISIFSNTNSFSARNIQKTARDYQDMKLEHVTYQLEKGMLEATHTPFTDMLVLLISAFIISTMIMEEKSKQLFSIIKTTIYGHGHTIIAKCMVSGLSILCILLLLYGSNLCYQQFVYGLGDMSASLISLASYNQSTLSLTIGQFLCLFLTTKWLAACVIGCLMMAISIAFDHKITCFGGILLLLGLELCCYLYIPSNTAFELLKYLNIFSFLETDTFYQMYLNLNIATYPFSLQKIALITLFTLFTLSFILCFFLYQKKKHLQLRIPMLQNGLPKRSKKHIYALSLWKQESYKLFRVQKGIWLILLFVFLQWYSHQDQLYISMEQHQWMSYMDKLAGPANEEKDAFLQAQDTYYRDLHDQYEQIQQCYLQGSLTLQQKQTMLIPIENQLYGEQAFQNIKEYYAYIKQDPHREALISYGYEYLFFQDSTNLIPALLILLFVILTLSNIVCYDYEQHRDRLIFSTKLGKQSVWKVKLMLALLCGVCFSVIAISFDVWKIHQTYGFSSLHASITSLTQFSMLPPEITILQFIIFTWFCKLFAITCAICLLFGLSSILRQQMYVLIFASLIILLPLLFTSMKLSFLNNFSLLPAFDIANVIKDKHMIVPCFTATFYGSLSVYAIYLTFRKET
ncbi:hypothetical protein [[Eubacterium] hominis]|uniref:hypothetical protein n=1 Tax=[Eubacterium] hominis TaxID=2764325 RepID=UPI003A4D2609